MRLSRFFSIVCFIGLTIASVTASADSPLSGFTELRVGNYYPSQIDEEPGLSGQPFADTYGTSFELMFEVEVDFYLYQHDLFGKFGLGGSLGQVSFTGPAEIQGGANNQSSTTQLQQAQSNGDQNGGSNGGSDNGNGGAGSGGDGNVSIQEETNFTVYPLRGSAVYMFDYHVRRWGIPVVPVLRAGLDYYLWQSTDGSGDLSVADGVEGSGGKAGWHAGAGLYLLLDVIDPGSAASMDSNWGINNSYLYVNYMKTQVDGFGDPGFDLSDDQVTFGLAFEF